MRQWQQGATLMGMLTTTVVVVALLLLVVRVVPLYADNYSINRILESLDERRNSDQLTVRSVRDYITKNFITNSLRDIPMDTVKVRRDNGAIEVNIDYERRVSLVGNVSLVVTFNNNWNSKSR